MNMLDGVYAGCRLCDVPTSFLLTLVTRPYRHDGAIKDQAYELLLEREENQPHVATTTKEENAMAKTETIPTKPRGFVGWMRESRRRKWRKVAEGIDENAVWQALRNYADKQAAQCLDLYVGRVGIDPNAARRPR